MRLKFAQNPLLKAHLIKLEINGICNFIRGGVGIERT